jgi:hypothetical protein
MFWFLPSAVRIREEKEAVFSNLKWSKFLKMTGGGWGMKRVRWASNA